MIGASVRSNQQKWSRTDRSISMLYQSKLETDCLNDAVRLDDVGLDSVDWPTVWLIDWLILLNTLSNMFFNPKKGEKSTQAFVI